MFCLFFCRFSLLGVMLSSPAETTPGFELGMGWGWDCSWRYSGLWVLRIEPGALCIKSMSFCPEPFPWPLGFKFVSTSFYFGATPGCAQESSWQCSGTVCGAKNQTSIGSLQTSALTLTLSLQPHDLPILCSILCLYWFYFIPLYSPSF